jgi:DNA-binding transcriptional MerR regulator
VLTIGEVSDMLGITRRAIRFYEQMGFVDASRAPHGVRLFDDTARRRLLWISRLRAAGVGLHDVREVLDLEANDDRRRQFECAISKLSERIRQLRAEIDCIEPVADLFRSELGLLEASRPTL